MKTIDQLLLDAEFRLQGVLSCLTFRENDPQAIPLARISAERALADVRAAQAKLEAPHRRVSDAGGGVVLDPGSETPHA